MIKLMLSAKSACAMAAVVSLVACGGGEKAPNDTSKAAPAASSSGGVDLTGAGATFPYPIYAKWFSDYAAKTGVKINYQSIGSGGGIRQISEGTVDFGASDSPMTDDELSKAKGGKLLHFPTVMGGDVLVFNLAGVRTLKLTGDVIADIF